MTSEVKINYAYVTTQDICSKFIEVNFVWDVWFDDQTVCSNIEHPCIINNKIIIIVYNTKQEEQQ